MLHKKGKKDCLRILRAKMLFASSKPEGKKKTTTKTSVWGQCPHRLVLSTQSLLYKYHMRCSGKKFLVSSNYLIGKVTLNFPVPFPALCCTLIPNTCAHKQKEMREVPFFLHHCSLKLGNPPKAVYSKFIVLRQQK